MGWVSFDTHPFILKLFSDNIINQTNHIMSTYKPKLTPKEKIAAAASIFYNNNNKKKISNIQNYLADSFKKIDGFDARWSTLISNDPLLFEDTDYLRVRQCIQQTTTNDEIEAYKRGDLRELYVTFESMLMCNLKHYDRIMRYATIILLGYVRLSDNDITTEHLNQVIRELEITPTRLWCCAMANSSSTEWELNYAFNRRWKDKNFLCKSNDSNKSPFELNFKHILHNQAFRRFIEYSAYCKNSNGFRETLLADITSNRKLSIICKKFTSKTTAISEQQLDSIYEYYEEVEAVKNRLYKALDSCMAEMFAGEQEKYAIYVYHNEFFIHSAKFSMKVSKSVEGKITKDYIANSYECFMAESYLINSVKAQIEWAKFKLRKYFEYDKIILKTLLENMLETDYKNIMAFIRMNEYGIVSKVTFSGIFKNVKIKEEFLIDNRCIKIEEKVLSKKNAASYLIDKGYVIFGMEEDIYRIEIVNKQTLIKHYMNYTIPVYEELKDVILAYEYDKNSLIEMIVYNKFNQAKKGDPEKIKYTEIYNASNKSLMSELLKRQTDRQYKIKDTYWKVIDSED